MSNCCDENCYDETVMVMIFYLIVEMIVVKVPVVSGRHPIWMIDFPSTYRWKCFGHH
jgi:hypothetical protein